MTSAMTILIAVRNGSPLIERAVASCLPETGCPLVVIDDHSVDDTVARAERVGGARLRLVRAPEPGGLSIARRTGLAAIDTEFAAWLDADDEWIPGRAARLAAMLRAGADVASEAIELHDGASGAWLRRMTVPAFLRRPGGAVRLFERNFLPGDAQVGFRTEVFRAAGGYDPAIYAPDFDPLLRALRGGARFAYGDDPGYRMYAYGGSMSRNIGRFRTALAAALSKHDYADVRRKYQEAGYDSRITAWGLTSMALFRGDPAAALAFLDEASPASADPEEILEPEGPWPFREGWRRAFQRGTILLLLGDGSAAARELRRAEALEVTPEGANNLGVALKRTCGLEQARPLFADALERRPDYADAAANFDGAALDRITTHPLRRDARRTDYPGARQPARNVERKT
jgi:hypothetical protein